jgi:hypothetical protein
MTAEQLQRARKLFEKVSAEDQTVRTDLLQRERAGDPAVAALVEQMIKADAEAQPILDQPLRPRDTGELRAGDRVGKYRIVREIGMGGMGAVYQAEPGDGNCAEPGAGFVAIKVVRWYSDEVSLRFKHEQAILSGLQHPNIARLLDSGTTGSLSPYFVMEYVDGLPIHVLCEGKELVDRLRLFRQVCAAVAYLHRHLVVHRDLKPGNVLVTADGTVKLVDFGIAKLLHAPDGLLSPVKTIAGLMTPDYASPEQIRGAATSTLTDVYSLGVLLYELLTGERPFTAPVGEVHETLRRICEEEPRKPSVTGRGNRQLRGELDNIILKAIRKEPERRYASAEQFDEDLRRYLNQEPVLAQGDSIGYRTRKFAARHKGGVAAGFTMLLLLAGGVVATSIEAGNARRAEALAEQHARDADRRLAALQKLAKGVVRVYNSNQPGVAESVHDSLLALRLEPGLEPGLRDVLDRIESAGQTSDPSWDVPQGWKAIETQAKEYRVGRDQRVVHSGKSSLFLRSLATRPVGSVYVYQRFDAKAYRGKRVRLTAFLRSEGLDHEAALSLFAAYEFGRTTLAGTTPWKKYELVVDVPAASEAIRILLTQQGAGTVWADDFSFKQVDSTVPLSIRRPENLSFTKP